MTQSNKYLVHIKLFLITIKCIKSYIYKTDPVFPLRDELETNLQQ